MIRPDEAEYWDNEAQKHIKPDTNRLPRFDNVWKRKAIIKRILRFNLIKANVLEIGIGAGTVFACLKVLHIGTFRYVGTDVSKVYTDYCSINWAFDARQADVTEIPAKDNQFDYVFALDTLEHVRPEDRQKGYEEINRVMKKDALIVLNIPMTPTLHDLKFDHGFTFADWIQLIETCQALPSQWEVYNVQCNSELRTYVWAVAERHL